MNGSVSRKVFFDLESLIWLSIFTFLLILINLSVDISEVVIISAIISGVSTCFRSHGLQLVVQIFALSYWISLIPFYFYSLPYHILTDYQSEYATNFVVLSQACLTRIIFVHSFDSRIDYSILLRRKSKFSFWVSFFTAACFFVIVILTNKTILTVGYIERNDQGSILMEYALIPVVVAYLNSRLSYQKLLVFVLCLVFFIVPLLYGKRLPSLFFLMLIFAFFFQNKVNRKQVFLITVLGILGMNAIGVLRDGVGFDDWAELLFGYQSAGHFSNNQGGVVISSVTYFTLANEEILDFLFAIKSFLGQFLVLFVPSGFVFEETFVNIYVINNYASIPGAGGFTSTYFYIWGGFLGLYLGFLIFFLIFRMKENKAFVAIVHLLLFVTFFRWFGYNIFPVAKIIFWFFIYFYTVNFFSRLFRRF